MFNGDVTFSINIKKDTFPEKRKKRKMRGQVTKVVVTFGLRPTCGASVTVISSPL